MIKNRGTTNATAFIPKENKNSTKNVLIPNMKKIETPNGRGKSSVENDHNSNHFVEKTEIANIGKRTESEDSKSTGLKNDTITSVEARIVTSEPKSKDDVMKVIIVIDKGNKKILSAKFNPFV